MTPAFKGLEWQPPSHWTRISTVDMHTGGEPLRVILGGPPIEGSTVLEKRRYFREHFDHLRTGLMWEPRGHADMYGAIVTESASADLDVFFIHNEGYSTMCGHAIIALTKLAIEAGWVRTDSDCPRLSINVPAGRIEARARVEGTGRVTEVSFRNVPSFVYRRDQDVEVPGIGRVQYSLCYGGAFYAVVEAAPLGLALTGDHYAKIVQLGRQIKKAVMGEMQITHPYEPDLSFLYGTIFTAPAIHPANHSRNVTVFADGEVDRSATGSGVSARAALHYSRGDLDLNQTISIESILGSTMSVRVVEKTLYGVHDAVIPEVSGTAHFTGRHEFLIDPDDPLNGGFIFR